MKKRLILSLAILTIISASCTPLVLSLITKSTVNKDVLTYRNISTHHKITYIPTVHLGKKGYYRSIQTIVDSLRKKKYIILYEGINTRKQPNDTIQRKFRKVVGFHLTSRKNQKNKSFPKVFKSDKYIGQLQQPLGIRRQTDINADLRLDTLISIFEKEYKEIVLSSCDFNTPLLEEYNCKDSVKYSSYPLLITIRNEHLFNVINKHRNEDLVIIYGKGHKFMLHAFLIKNGYELTSGKL